MSAAWPPQPILVIGASARAACHSALRSRRRQVIAADLFCDRDLASHVQGFSVDEYPQEFLEVVRTQSRVHPNLAIVYTGALENYPDLIDECSEMARLLGNGSEVLRSVRDPFKVSLALRQQGIPFPEVRRQLNVDAPGMWLRKHFHSAGGQRVEFADRDRPTKKPENTRTCFYQEFVSGTPCSAAYVRDQAGCQLLGVSEMLVGQDWLGATGFQYCGSLERRPVEAEVESWRELGRVLCQHFGLRGVFGVDAIVQAERVHPIEVNPRFTASMELFDSPDISVFERHVQAFAPGFNTESPGAEVWEVAQDNELRGKCILYAKRNVEFPEDVTQLSAAGIDLADIPRPQLIPAGYPILTLLAGDREPGLLREKLQKAAAHVYSKLSQKAGL